MLSGVLAKVYAAIGVGLLALYFVSETRGAVYSGTDERATLPTSVRTSPGGYRSSSFWFSGIHGGK